MQAEMREHLDRTVERLMARGMTREDAQLAARREFGNVGVIQEEARDARGSRWIESLTGDVRFAFRYFSRNKLTVAILVSVLAVGIGGTTALVTVIQSQFFRPAPGVPDEDALVRIWSLERPSLTDPWHVDGFSQAELNALTASGRVFTGVAGWREQDVVVHAGDSVGARGVGAQYVTPNYFTVLGTRLSAGVGFAAAVPGEADMSAVMSFALAEQLYGSAANAVGQVVRVNQMAVRVAGVAPPAFQGAIRNMGGPGLWLPLSARAHIARVPQRWLEGRTLSLIGRLAPGVTHEQASVRAQLVVTQSLPDSASRIGLARRAPVLPLTAQLPGPETKELIAIFTALGLIGLLLLLVTCTNVSSLMVAAAISRRHEIAVRLSLGASRTRILRQLLTETVLLTVAGGAAGLLACWWLVRAVAGPLGAIEGLLLTPDANTLAFTLAISLGTGIVFGLSPALHATRGMVATALHDSGVGMSRRSRLQRGFVVAQIVFSVPLLVGMGVLFSAVLKEFDPLRREVSERVVGITFRPLEATGAPENQRAGVESLVSHIAARPEVRSVVPDASTIENLAILPSSGAATVSDQGPREIRVEGVTPGWFATLDIRLLVGRDVSLADTASRDWPVVIGNDLAQSLWGNSPAIGRTLMTSTDSIRFLVIGVYDAAAANTSTGTVEDEVYTARGKRWRRDRLLVRTHVAALPFLPSLRSLVRDRAPGLPVARMETIAQENRRGRIETLKISGLVGAGGALALLLASLGLYGVIAVAVRQRTREIGIRIALGSEPGRVSKMIVGSGIRLSLTALVIGLPLTAVFLRIVLGSPVDSANEWLIGAIVSLALLVIAAAASWIPARRASRVDPSSTLRTQ